MYRFDNAFWLVACVLQAGIERLADGGVCGRLLVVLADWRCVSALPVACVLQAAGVPLPH